MIRFSTSSSLGPAAAELFRSAPIDRKVGAGGLGVGAELALELRSGP
jgi:hypothetical protein